MNASNGLTKESMHITTVSNGTTNVSMCLMDVGPSAHLHEREITMHVSTAVDIAHFLDCGIEAAHASNVRLRLACHSGLPPKIRDTGPSTPFDCRTTPTLATPELPPLCQSGTRRIFGCLPALRPPP